MIKRILQYLIAIVFITVLCIVFSGDDTPADKIADVTHVSSAQAEKIEEILKNCGFDSYDIEAASQLDNKTGAGEKGYIINFAQEPSGATLLLAPNGSVYKIYLPKYDIYADGKVKHNVYDFVFTAGEKEKIKNQIKASLNAQFKALGMKDEKQAEYFGPYDWHFNKVLPMFSAGSYVVVTNNVGDKRRYDFPLKLIRRH